MADKKPVHVVPHDDGWAVKREGGQRASSVHSTQAEAVQQAQATARADKTEALTHGRDGKIRARNSYGDDPYPPLG